MNISGRDKISCGECVCDLKPSESGFGEVMRLEYGG